MSARRGVAGMQLDAALALGLSAALVVLAFVSTGGFDGSISVSGANTWSEIVLVLLGTGVVVAMLGCGARGRAWGGLTVTLFAGLAVYTALSILWSVAPDDSWQAANLTLAYLMTFAAGAALARIAPERWRVLIGAIAIVAVVVSGYALLSKVFPGTFDRVDAQGRLEVPIGYWNALGALAVIGIPPLLWAFTRREVPVWLRGLAVPATAILVTVVVLSYSRTALVVMIAAVITWLVLVPGRLRAAAGMGLSGAGAAVLCGYALSQSGLTGDGQSLAARTDAGHTLGVLVVVIVVGLAVAGWATARAIDRSLMPAAVRRRVGTLLLSGAALVPVLVVIALAASSRGLTGEISHAWQSLTSVKAVVGNSASRIGQLGSSRPLYWSEGITVGDHYALGGAGALAYATARLHYTNNATVVGHAHSYIVQTYADLGVIGLALNLALLVAWGLAALRAVGWRPRAAGGEPERTGLVCLLILVVAFGLLSAADWTWYFPGVTVPALLAAGWLAGRGPLLRPVGRAVARTSILSRPGAAGLAALVSVLALVGAFLVWQPLRASQDATAALTAGAAGNGAQAFSDARSAVAADPLALQPRFVLAQLYDASGDQPAARAQLVSAARQQPDNHESWLQLGSYDLNHHHPRLALLSLIKAFGLDVADRTTIDALASARAEIAAAGHTPG